MQTVADTQTPREKGTPPQFMRRLSFDLTVTMETVAPARGHCSTLSDCFKMSLTMDMFNFT